MKRIISGLAAFAVCAFMFAACGENSGSAEINDETSLANETIIASVVEETTVSTTAATTSETSASSEETEEETSEAEVTDEDILSYASLDEFANSDLESIEGTEVVFSESLTYDFLGTLEDAEGFYLDVESVDGKIAMTMAFADRQISLDAIDETGERFIVIIKDSTMYMLDPAEKSGFYMQTDEDIWDEYNSKDMLDEINIDEESIKNNDYLYRCPVEIDGEEYTCEFDEESYFIYDTDNDLCAIALNDDSYEVNALIVHKFTGDVPSSAFDIPEGYEMTDLDAALAALQ